MGILIEFFRDMRRWDMPSKVALALALVLLAVMIAFLVLGGENARNPALIGMLGLLGSIQAIALWGNRHLVSAYTLAQRSFMSGDFEQTRTTLENLIRNNQEAHKNTDVDVYVLLGNTYRSLGDIEASLRVLRQAVHSQPEYPFALYGLGRTLLTQGDYEEALTSIKKSLLHGAPNVVKFDLGLAYFLAKKSTEAQNYLSDILPSLNEAHRQLMAQWILYTLHQAEKPNDKQVSDGLAFWQSEINRFAHTPYGQDIQQLVDLLVK